MIHNSLQLPHHKPSEDVETSAHWAVGKNERAVLLQVDDGREQARIAITPEETLEIALALLENAKNFLVSENIEKLR